MRLPLLFYHGYEIVPYSGTFKSMYYKSFILTSQPKRMDLVCYDEYYGDIGTQVPISCLLDFEGIFFDSGIFGITVV